MLTIYKASAGSGKTFTLAYEYIKCLLGVKGDTGRYSLRTKITDPYRGILAITFTNKATEEMKSRIVKELADIAKGKSTYYKKMLVKEFGCTPDKLEAKAGEVLRKMLLDFNFFNVSTIDSFFQTILRTFAREAELTGDYEVALDNQETISEGLRRFFDSLGQNDKVSRRYIKGITDYLKDRLRNNDSVMLFNRDSGLYSDIFKVIKGLSNDTFDENYENLRDYFANPNRINEIFVSTGSKIKELEERAVDLAVKAAAIIEGLPPRAMHNDILKNLKSVAQKNKKISVLKKSAEAIATRSLPYNKGFLKDHPGYPVPEDDILDALEAAKEFVDVVPFLRSLRSNMFMLALMMRVYEFIGEYRVENNSLLLSDSNSLLEKIIGDEETPFIYERLGTILHHYLIDEFQDTSEIQWKCLRPLVETGVGDGKDSLIIGDEKQCIYRFRNSDPTLLGEQVAAHIKNNRIEGNTPEKNTNYRSSRDVVEFNNVLFGELAAKNDFSSIYSNVVQSVADKHKDEKGFIRIKHLAELDKKELEDSCETLLPKVAEDIQDQLKRGYAPKDIAVLVRKSKEGQRLISYLANHQDDFDIKYNIISDDLMPVGDSPAVRLILSTLRSIAYPVEEQTSSKYKSLKEAKAFMARYEIALLSGAHPSEAIDKALVAEDVDTARIDTHTIIDTVEGVIATLPKEMRERENPYICAFQDLITDYTTFGMPDLRSFLRWWNDFGKKKIISAPEDPNAIRVMTIHKSKGLQFKCVHIPFCNWDVNNFMSYSWFKAASVQSLGLKVGDAPLELPEIVPFKPGKSLHGTPLELQYDKMCKDAKLDELNVLYVAFTRAERELTVYYFQPSRANCPISGLIEEAMNVKFADNLREDGEYVFGEPTEPVVKEKSAEDDGQIKPLTEPMPEYFTVEVPDNLGWEIDDTPDAVNGL